MPKYLVLIPPPNVELPCLCLSQLQYTSPNRCIFPLYSTTKLRQLYTQDVTLQINTTSLVTMWSVLCLIRPKVTSLALKCYIVYSKLFSKFSKISFRKRKKTFYYYFLEFKLTNVKEAFKRTKAFVKKWLLSKSNIFNFKGYTDTISEVRNSIFYGKKKQCVKLLNSDMSLRLN